MSLLEVTKKSVQGAVMSALGLVIPVWVQPSMLERPHPWILIGVGVIATVYQPSYTPTEGSRTTADRGTARQILWTIYLCNFAALMEAVLVDYPASLRLDAAALIGLALMLVGLGLRSWAVVTLGRWFTWNVRLQEGQEVIQHGPYRLVRHPSYTGALLTYLFLPLFLHSWWSLGLAAVLLPLAFLRRIKHEEQLLCESLAGYADYREKSAALIPWIL